MAEQDQQPTIMGEQPPVMPEATPEVTPQEPMTPPVVEPPMEEVAPSGQPDEIAALLADDSLSDLIDPDTLEQLRTSAQGKMSLGQVIALSGLAMTNPQMAQQVMQQEYSKAENAKATLATLQGQAHQFKKSLLLQHMKEKQAEEKWQQRYEAWERRDLQRIGGEAAAKAAEAGVSYTPMPADYRKIPDWMAELQQQTAEVRGQQARTKQVREALDAAFPYMREAMEGGAEGQPVEFQEALRGSLILGGAPEEFIEQNWESLYNTANLMWQTARKQAADADALRAKIEAETSAIATRLEQAERRIAIEARKADVAASQSINRLLNSMDITIRNAQAQSAAFRVGAATAREYGATDEAKAYEDGAAALDALAAEALIRQTDLQEVALSAQARRPDTIIMTTFANRLPMLGQILAVDDPKGWLAANPYEDEAIAFWDAIVSDIAAQFPELGDRSAVGMYVEGLMTEGGGLYGQPDPLVNYGPVPQPTGAQND